MMGKLVVTIIILSANTASCLIYTSSRSDAYASMITDAGLISLFNGYYLFAVDCYWNINRILSIGKLNFCYCDTAVAVNDISYPCGF